MDTQFLENKRAVTPGSPIVIPNQAWTTVLYRCGSSLKTGLTCLW